MTPGEAMRWQTLGYQVVATAPTASPAAEDLRAEVDHLARLVYWFGATREGDRDRGPEASTAVLSGG